MENVGGAERIQRKPALNKVHLHKYAIAIRSRREGQTLGRPCMIRSLTRSEERELFLWVIINTEGREVLRSLEKFGGALRPACLECWLVSFIQVCIFPLSV